VVIVKTIEEFNAAVAQMQGVGGLIEIQESSFPKISLGKILCPDNNPLRIVGNGCSTNSITIMDCHNIIVEWFKVTGKNYNGCSVELNDSYPEIGLKNIKIKGIDIDVLYGGRGIFTGGHVMNGIKIVQCHIRGPILGTHGIYCSGGHWDSVYPPCSDFVIRGNTIELQPGGRNCLQFNGRFENVDISNNSFSHSQLNLITLIGVRKAKIYNNTGYGANRGSFIVVYDYASHWAPYYNYFRTQADIDLFCETHWSCQDIDVEHNTAVVGPKRFSVDAYHSDDPTAGHPWALINNAVHSGFLFWDPTIKKHIEHPGFEFPTKNINLRYNIMASPNPNLIDTYNKHEGEQTTLIKNMLFTASPKPIVVGQSGIIAGAADNIIKNPDFHQWPKYGFVDMIQHPTFPWDQFKSSFDGFSEPGYHAKVGRKSPIFQPSNKVVMAMGTIEAMMEMADPIIHRTETLC
jgi:hypothetical protein